MAKYYASDAISIAQKEVGYLEKKSNKNLDSKTANSGSNNYTKYGVLTGTNGDYWCASFITWVFYTLCNHSKDTAKKLLCGAFSASCETIRSAFVKADRYYKTPKKGDLIFFSGTRHSGANHIGIVTKVVSNKIYTIEGNTSGSTNGADKVVDNGGAVCQKSYSTSNSKILGFGRPKYDKKATTALTVKTKCRLYKKANIVSGSYSLLTVGKQLEFVSDTKKGWSKVRTMVKGNIGTGYVKNSCLSGKSGLSTYLKGTICVAKAPIRAKNKKSSKQLGTAKKGDKFTVVSVGKLWTNIKYKGKNAFVFNKKISVK